MRYKVGDKVKVRSLEWFNNHPHKEGEFVSSMFCYCGKWTEIKEVIINTNDSFYKNDEILYRVNIDDERWIWQEYMFDKNADRKLKLQKLEHEVGLL